MEKGLMWLPLLAFFSWLTWNGWNEYQKVEAYNLWSKDFDTAKYDIYSVIGLKNKQVTWGQPKRTIPDNLPSFLLSDVKSVMLLINNNVADLSDLPRKGKASIQFVFIKSDEQIVTIPFTDISLAAKWAEHLNNLTLNK